MARVRATTAGPFVSTTTNANGVFTLGVDYCPPYAYVHVIEVDPAGTYSTGAQVSSPGLVRNYNCVTYRTGDLGRGGTFSGTKFWDALRATPTPTRTPPPQVTRTPTVTPTRPASGADLEISKWGAAGLPAVPGGTLQYNIQVWSHGPSAASNVVFTDVLPSRVTFDAAFSGCTLVAHGPPNDIVRCNLGNLPTFPPGTNVRMQVRVKDDACGTLTNRAQVSSDTPDPNPANNTTQLDTPVRPCPQQPLVVTKALVNSAGGVASVGDVVRFRITVFLRARAPCWPSQNCVRVLAEDANGLPAHAEACLPVHAGLGPEKLYLPLALKLHRP